MGERDHDRQPEDELSYEEAVERLEAIIDRIESGEIGLEESIAQYERGMALVRRCRDVLDRAQQRIETLEAERLGEASVQDEADGADEGDGA